MKKTFVNHFKIRCSKTLNYSQSMFEHVLAASCYLRRVIEQLTGGALFAPQQTSKPLH